MLHLFFIISVLSISLISVSSCASYQQVSQNIVQTITPYRLSIVQGNFVSHEAAFNLKSGMSRNQVRLLLGTPLLTDIFHQDQWDYIFYFKRGKSNIVQERKLTVYFKNDQLSHFDGGNNLPSEYELVEEIDGQRS